MLIHTLIQYLESHRRLVVPQLGTFIVKEPGRSVVFSELLKRDDGVLRGLLRAGGMGELEPRARSTASFSRSATPWSMARSTAWRASG